MSKPRGPESGSFEFRAGPAASPSAARPAESASGRAGAPAATSPSPARAQDGAPIYTVSEVNRIIRELLESRLGSVWITGEVSNLRVPSSGHCYFTLKDDAAQISMVMWRATAAGLRFRLKEGDAVVVRGEVTVYEPRGQYQVVAWQVEPLGIGALQMAFMQLKERLEKEGLFASERKRPLPVFPETIALVTSPTGAAVHDMINTIRGRYPSVRIILCPARVQGEGAAEEIANGIAAANALGGVDVLIVGRGGGSLEDLWAFNEEVVARAIAASRAPVVSAVGHETDFTISDFVADVRARTPTDAGHLVVPDVQDLRSDLHGLAERMAQALTGRVATARETLDGLARRSELRRFVDRLRAREQELDDIGQEIYRGIRRMTEKLELKLAAVSARLESLSPFAVLRRGYSLTTRESDRSLLRDASTLQPGERVRTRLAQGEFLSNVEKVL